MCLPRTERRAAMPAVLLGGPRMFWKAVGVYAVAFIAVAVLAQAAIVGIGLPGLGAHEGTH